LISGCGDDDDDGLDPNAPVASFTYESDNDFEAPTMVTFTSTSQNAWTFIWDFGNGETSNSSTFTSTTYSVEGTYTVKLVVIGESGTDSTSTDIVVTPFAVDVSELDGKWSITSEAHTFPNGRSSETINFERPVNWSTLEFNTDNTYQRINMSWAEWETGSFHIEVDRVITEPFDGIFDGMNILITSLTDNVMEAELTVQEEDNGVTFPVEIKLVLGRNGPGVSTMTMSDILGKWSQDRTEVTTYGKSDVTFEYSQAKSQTDRANIPLSRYTLGFMDDGKMRVIDHLIDGGYYDMTYTMLDGSNFWVVDNEGENTLVQVESFAGNYLAVKLVWFGEDIDGMVRYEANDKYIKHDGSQYISSVTEEYMVGVWDVTGSGETKDGNTVDSSEMEAPPAGSVFTFNADGSVDLLDPEPGSWYLMDENNIAVEPFGKEEALYLVQWLEVTTDEMTLYRLWENENDGSRMEQHIVMKKQ